MRETQFYICLAVTLGLLLLVIPVILLLRKRLPTIQKKIFFAQVWLASMVIVLMPLYYHFYKVAMYYSVSVALLSLTITGFAIIYYLTPDSDNPNIRYYEPFISFNSFLLGIGLFITNLILSYSYYVHCTDENWYGYAMSFLILTIYTFYLIPLPQFYVKIRKYTFVIFYGVSIVSVISIRLLAISTVIDQFIIFKIFSYISSNIMIFIIPISILFCAINIYLINKRSLINLRFLVYNIINVIICAVFLSIVSNMNFEYYELLPSDLSIWHFVLIGILNTSILIPYILMSHTMLFTPKVKEVNHAQPTQIGNEPTNMS